MNLNELKKSLYKHQINQDTKISVAFSGGPDSVFLVAALFELGYQPLLIYINYHDSPYVKEEEKIVKQISEKYSLELISDNVTISDTKNFEDEARRYRYNLFETINLKRGIKYLLTAHQLDDLIETYFMQKERNSIVEYYGLKEMNILGNLNIYRPILSYTKKEIKEYLIINHIPFFDDPTNYNLTRKRNYLRSTLTSCKYEEVLAEIKKENDYLSLLEEKFNTELKDNNIKYSFYISLKEKEKRRLLYSFLKNNLHYQDKIKSYVNLIYERLLGKNSFIETILDKAFIFDKEYLRCVNCNIFNEYEYKILKPGHYDFPLFSLDIALNKFNIKEFPIIIRNIKPNDKISTKIMQNDANSFVKKMKVPKYLRSLYPVFLNSNNQVIYIPYYDDIKLKKLPLKFNSH